MTDNDMTEDEEKSLKEYVVNYLVALGMHEPEAQMLHKDFVNSPDNRIIEIIWMSDLVDAPESTKNEVICHLNVFAADWCIKFQPCAPYRQALEDAVDIQMNVS